MSIRARKYVVPAVFALGAASVALTGCGGTGLTGLRLNPTPELLTLNESGTEGVNDLALMSDMNLRMFIEDGSRVLYINRPSHLSPTPIPRR